jgi:hypothetical protein
MSDNAPRVGDNYLKSILLLFPCQKIHNVFVLNMALYCIILYCIISLSEFNRKLLCISLYTQIFLCFWYNPNIFRIFFGIRISRILIARLLNPKVLLPSTSENFSWLSSSTMNITIFPKPLVVAACYWWEHYLFNSPKWNSVLYILPNLFFSKFCTSILTIKSNSMVPKSSQCFLPI